MCRFEFAYDLKLAEDNDKNCMEESTKLFDSIVNTEHLLKSGLILFMNKMDIFTGKTKVSPITMCFPDYNGNKTFTSGVAFIKEKYLERNRNETKEIYVHETCATGTENMDFVFKDVVNILMKENFKKAGLA